MHALSWEGSMEIIFSLHKQHIKERWKASNQHCRLKKQQGAARGIAVTAAGSSRKR